MSSELRQILKNIDRQFGLDQCTSCIKTTHMKDTLGFPWCEEHEHHGQLMSWGYRHGYPQLRIDMEHRICFLGPGEMDWWNVVVCSAATSANKGDEELIWAALFHTEYLDSIEEKAS